MMREILFRGRTTQGKEWISGFYGAYSKTPFIGAHNSYGTMLWFEVDPETVGQYTGLRDCKRTAEYPEGQMIFEGDVIKVVRDLHCGENKKEREIFSGVVWYDDKHTCFGIKSKKYRCLPIHRFIHDNPELLKEGGE